MSKKDEAEEGVGYGRPPKGAQFKPGVSGNPKGRPKGTLNFTTDLRATFKQPVNVNSGGRSRKITTQKAMLARLREKALNGDGRSLDRFLQLAQIYNNDEQVKLVRHSIRDLDVLRVFLARARDNVLPEELSPRNTDDENDDKSS